MARIIFRLLALTVVFIGVFLFFYRVMALGLKVADGSHRLPLFLCAAAATAIAVYIGAVAASLLRLLASCLVHRTAQPGSARVFEEAATGTEAHRAWFEGTIIESGRISRDPGLAVNRARLRSRLSKMQLR